MRAYLIGLILPLTLTLSMNHGLGVGGLADSAVVAKLAARQTDRQSVVSPAPVDHRTWVRTRLLDTERCPDIIVSGSSTSGALSAEMFPGHQFFNGWLGGPSVEDFQALTAVLRRMACHPKSIVVGTDPWWLGNPSYSEVRWMAWADDYLAYQARDGLAASALVRARVDWASFEDDLSYTTTHQSLLLLGAAARGHAQGLRLVDGSPSEICESVPAGQTYYVRGADGHFEKCPFPSAERRQEIARNYLRANMHLMGTWSALATKRLADFSALVREWRASGASVTLVTMPYNPIAYDVLLHDVGVRRLLGELDERLEALAGDGVTVVQLRDPTVPGCAEAEFVDSHHARPSCAQKVAATLRARVPSLK